MADPVTVSIALSNFEKAAKVVKGLDSVSRLARSAGLGSILPEGKTDASIIVEALEAMTERITAALGELQKHVQDKTNLDLLQERRQKLTAWKVMIKERLDELNSYPASPDPGQTVDPADTNKYVRVRGRRTSVAAWCEGERRVKDREKGVLDELGDFVGGLDSWLEVSVREEGGSLVDDWDFLKASGTAGRSLGLMGETRYSAMLIWFQAICALLSTAVYVRNAALALYREAKPRDVRFVSLDADLDELGQVGGVDQTGAVRQPSNTWKLFDTKFDTFLKTSMLQDGEGLHVRHAHQGQPAERSGYSEDHSFTCLGFRSIPGADSYIAGLNIGHMAGQGHGYWLLEATVVAINPDGTHMVIRECHGERSDFSNRCVDIRKYAVGSADKPFFLAPGDPGPVVSATQEKRYQLAAGMRSIPAGGQVFGTGVIDVPVADPGWHTVATGFGMVKVDGAWVICLQYGQMGLDAQGRLRVVPHPRMPWTDALARPRIVTDRFRLADDIDQLYRGMAGTDSLMPITNATFRRVNKYELDITVSCAPRLYQFDALQPTYLKRYSPLPKETLTATSTQAGGSAGPVQRAT